MPFATHEAYLESVSPQARQRLEAIRAQVEALLPSATRCIGYSMPAYKDGRFFFYFASFKNHIGIYPPLTEDAALVQELEPYRGPKGNLSFPYNEPLPLELIGRVAVALHRQYASANNPHNKKQ